MVEAACHRHRIDLGAREACASGDLSDRVAFGAQCGNLVDQQLVVMSGLSAVSKVDAGPLQMLSGGDAMAAEFGGEIVDVCALKMVLGHSDNLGQGQTTLSLTSRVR